MEAAAAAAAPPPEAPPPEEPAPLPTEPPPLPADEPLPMAVSTVPLPMPLNHQTALVVHGEAGTTGGCGADSSSSESEPDEEELPPGPLEPERCSAHGPGFAGGAAGAPVKLTITSKDERGKRIREGGAYVRVGVEPTGGGERLEAEVTDHANGQYTAVYAVPAKGNYKLYIDINGAPMGGSPFPLFFSAPDPNAAKAAAAAAAAPSAAPGAAPGLPGVPVLPGALPGVPLALSSEAIAAQAGASAQAYHMAAAFPNLATGINLSLGAQAARAGVEFPSADLEELQRVVLVGNVSPFATADALRSVFGFCGTIRSVTLAGPANSFAFVEYEGPAQAHAALQMGGLALMGQCIRVEVAREARLDADKAATTISNPYLALHTQQAQQFKMLQARVCVCVCWAQQTQLAQHVAAMRAAQRTGVAPPPLLSEEEKRKKAALAAALALSKKLASGDGKDGDNGRKRSRSRSRSRERKDRRRRSRSRSRDRRRRSRSRERKHHRHHHHHRSHRHRSRSRGRKEKKEDRDRDRKRDRGERKRGREDKERGGRREEGGGDTAAGAAAEEQPKDELEELFDELEGGAAA
eukprot:scaffold7.g3421.t1